METQIIKIFPKNTGYNLTLAGPVSRNETVAASKGVGHCEMNVNPAAGLYPLVMTLRLKELAQTVLNRVAMSQTAPSLAGCLSVTLPSWHRHLYQLYWGFSRPNLSRLRLQFLHKNHLSLRQKFQHLAEPRVIKIKRKGRLNKYQPDFLSVGPSFEKSLCPRVPLIRDCHFSTSSPNHHCQGKGALRATGNLSSWRFCSSYDLGSLQLLSLLKSFSSLSSSAKLTTEQSLDSHFWSLGGIGMSPDLGIAISKAVWA